MDDDRQTFSLGRRPHRVEKHEPRPRIETPGWRAAQIRVIVAIGLVTALVVALVYAVVMAA